LVLLLRWYWWRINAWSEISAMSAAAVVSIWLQAGMHMDSDNPRDFAWIIIITVSITTVVWLATTYATKPESLEVLESFYRRTRPSSLGWGPIAARVPDVKPSRDGWFNVLDWLSGCLLIYGFLFGAGKLLLHETVPGLVLLAMGIAGGAIIYWDLNRRGWSRVVE
jgi:SSS family solute:Na+ symporter